MIYYYHKFMMPFNSDVIVIDISEVELLVFFSNDAFYRRYCL